MEEEILRRKLFSHLLLCHLAGAQCRTDALLTQTKADVGLVSEWARCGIRKTACGWG